MRQIRLVVQYDGTDYAGFQVQPDAATIQGELETALQEVLGHPAGVTSAGRTDAGVHALGQVVTLRTERPIPAAGLAQATNDILPPAMSIAGGDEVNEDFHPRYDAVAKLYSFRILNRAQPSPFIGRYAWHVSGPIDTQLMIEGAANLLGRHDFSAFEAAGGSTQRKVRDLRRLDVQRHGEIIEIRLLADGFLYRMARNIVGTLVDVGRGRTAPSAVGDMLASRDRSQAGDTAPPQGLCLVRVDY